MIQLTAIFTTITFSILLVSAVPVTRSSTGILPLKSPAYLPSFPAPKLTPKNPVPTGPLNYNIKFQNSHYPAAWSIPDTNHPSVKEAINSIDWSHVPKLQPRQQEESATLDPSKDYGCWWTSTLCTKPKVSYLPADVTYCKNPKDFGLTYDDGPLPPNGNPEDDKWAEPRLYDFLAKQNQRATLFYVGTNVAAYPEAALRALESGHTLCAHTWSHQHMTGLSDEEIVAEFYWNLRAIKEATGVTPRCWRPPYGDVDDRVRAIAYQMGMLTIIWDSDSFDWGLPSIANDFAGTYTEDTIDGYFQQWISERQQGLNRHGHIVLEHETSNMTVLVTEKWLPKLKQAFDVKPVHECAQELSDPYWES